MAPIRIIIDTDPGQDDAVALLLALASPDELTVEAVTTVGGNTGIENTTRNAAAILELAGRSDIPLYRGCDIPLVRPPLRAEHVHGESGLDGAALPPPSKQAEATHAVDFLTDYLRAQPQGAITLVTLAPMTNIALALRKAPDIAPRIARIVSMIGACFEGGNITPNAEFNAFVDPEAAKIVFGAGIPMVVLPLDVTHQMAATAARLAAIRAVDNAAARCVAGMLGFSERFDLKKFESDGAPLHDPCTIGWLLRPDLFQGREVNICVETQGEFCAGTTIVDYWRVTGRAPNALYLRDGNADGFYALLTERLARLG
ncbi:nucleoside hydrolase [Brytella acorum]|uniref:Nucleoside hydrolase n=1 Tax=Brytella acorum TaxID=2959299 RepID=A0AA35UH09_9PROT|nr:nucleoside hydrolase [Brytella acorum]MDF3623708.1 nucleoside hydrolase [Brytella acorum]CAI9119874.1 nucleoside hydrolase [Brytella acorum]